MLFREPRRKLQAAVFTTTQAEGALPNGARVVKVMTVKGDTHENGALATVLGSLLAPDGRFAYFVEWDDLPGLPVGICWNRITPVEAQG